jgi:hypothetical protein
MTITTENEQIPTYQFEGIGLFVFICMAMHAGLQFCLLIYWTRFSQGQTGAIRFVIFTIFITMIFQINRLIMSYNDYQTWALHYIYTFLAAAMFGLQTFAQVKLLFVFGQVDSTLSDFRLKAIKWIAILITILTNSGPIVIIPTLGTKLAPGFLKFYWDFAGKIYYVVVCILSVASTIHIITMSISTLKKDKKITKKDLQNKNIRWILLNLIGMLCSDLVSILITLIVTVNPSLGAELRVLGETIGILRFYFLMDIFVYMKKWAKQVKGKNNCQFQTLN